LSNISTGASLSQQKMPIFEKEHFGAIWKKFKNLNLKIVFADFYHKCFVINKSTAVYKEKNKNKFKKFSRPQFFEFLKFQKTPS